MLYINDALLLTMLGLAFTAGISLTYSLILLRRAYLGMRAERDQHDHLNLACTRAAFDQRQRMQQAFDCGMQQAPY